MEHQDWKPVIFTKPKKKTVVTAKKKVMSDTQIKNKKLDEATEVSKIAKVSLSFGKEMQQARCAKKLSQKELAQKLHVKQTVVASYEQGKAIPNNGFICKIERVLGVKLPRSNKKKKINKNTIKLHIYS